MRGLCGVDHHPISVQHQLHPTGMAVEVVCRQPVFELGEWFTGLGGGEGGGLVSLLALPIVGSDR